MAAITSAVLGATALGFGAYQYMEGRNQQREGLAQQRASLAEQQRGYRIQEQGANLQYGLELEKSQASRDYAQRNFDMNKAAAAASLDFAAQSQVINKGIVDTQFQQEAERQKAMEIDARRQQLEVIRNQQRSRAMALTTANAQGARLGSGLQGAYAQYSGQSNVNALGIQQNLDIGRNMFNLNRQLAGQKKQGIDLDTQAAFARAGQQTAQAQMMYDYALTNAGFQDRSADIQTNYMVRGQGIINAASGQYQYGASTMNAGQSQSQFGGTLMQFGMNLPGYGQTANNLWNNGISPTLSGFNMAGLGFNPASGRAGSYV